MAATFHPQVYRGKAAAVPAVASSINAGATPTKKRCHVTSSTSKSVSKSVQDEYNEQQQQHQGEYSDDEDCYYSSTSQQQQLPCHGLHNNPANYPLHPASTPSCVLRAITASQYAEMVYAHATAKTGEAVLFPWMHGADFAGSQQAANFGYVNGNRAPTPRYRGLTTIAAHPARSEQQQSRQEEAVVYDHSRQATSASIATSYSTDSFSSAYSSSSSNPSSCSSSVFGGSDSLQSAPSSASSISSCAQSIDLPKTSQFGPELHTSLLTSSWKPEEIFAYDGRFIKPSLPNNGVNFRNFRMQGPKYATISDIIVYGNGRGDDEDTVAIAKMAKEAIKDMYRERKMSGERDLIQYQVYIIIDSFNTFEQKFPHLVQVDSLGWPRNKTSFAEKEHEEMRAFTQATEIAENVWIGNTFDVPWPVDSQDRSSLPLPTSEGNPQQFSVCIEARDTAYMANTYELKEREKYMDDMQSKREHEARQDQLLALQQQKQNKRKPSTKASKVKKSRSPYWYSSSSEDDEEEVSSSKSSDSCSSRSSSDNDEDDSDYEEFSASRSGSDSDKENFQDALEGFSAAAIGSTAALAWRTASSASVTNKPAQFKKSKSLSAALAAKKDKIIEEKKEEVLRLSPEEILHLESFATSQNASHPSAHQIIIDAILEHCMWIRTQARPHLRTSLDIRGAKSIPSNGHIAARRVLIHCADGYTDSSLLTLAYIMYDRVCSLPEAYLYLQNEKKRSFFVYPLDVTLLGQLEKRIMALTRSQNRHRYNDDLSASQIAEMEKKEREEKAAALAARNAREPPSPTISTRSLLTRPSLFSRSSSANSSATISSIRSATPTLMAPLSRCTPSPSTSSTDAVAHAWFYDDRFDGHFPSRILDHVYLGNVNHASNALMLKELGITHVLSIGESALVPPHKHVQPTSSSFYSNASAAARARTPTNSLWLEQSLGNITVLDIQDIQDDGVDPILPHLLTAIEFIESAHQKGGKVLVHCRVGVSRSATLVIAYIMKHLDLSLVDAYLLVRAKRLNILIQPTILFMWTLHMYEEEIRESAFNEDEEGKENAMLVQRSARVTWPVLATEMANLNHKYLGV